MQCTFIKQHGHFVLIEAQILNLVFVSFQAPAAFGLTTFLLTEVRTLTIIVTSSFSGLLSLKLILNVFSLLNLMSCIDYFFNLQ